MNELSLVCLILGISLACGTIAQASAEQPAIPRWIRNDAKWWNQGQIQDSEFVKGMQYLIGNKVLAVSSSQQAKKDGKIPSWVKNTAGMWANGTISDNEFVSGIQYLVSSGIIIVKTDMTATDYGQCDRFATAAEKETCLGQLEYDAKIKNFLQMATPYVVGPITFYYVNTESQKADDGKTILIIHFVVRNNSGHEVTMTCQRQDSCNYVLSDGQNHIRYSTNTLVYGTMTLAPYGQKLLDWTFYSLIDSSKNYSFLIKEQWGSRSIPIKISQTG